MLMDASGTRAMFTIETLVKHYECLAASKLVLSHTNWNSAMLTNEI
jgi:hypothetical protein